MKAPNPTNVLKKPEALKREIIRLLDWDEQLYADAQYSTGIEYLEIYLEEDRHFADLLSRSKIFWQWWKNHWSNRDETFIEMLRGLSTNVRYRRELYVDFNNGKTLAELIHPNSIVLNETYAEMITEVVKIETTA
jgi:hypothetical protein